MRRASLAEITFHPHSFADPDGRVFLWEGGVYRGVRAGRAQFVERLLREGIFERLSDRGLLVETVRADVELEGFELVLSHGRIPLASYPTEWCAAMLRQSALTYLDLVRELASLGYGLKDTHAWNILFDGTRPLYVDVMSIAPLEETRSTFSDEKFRRYYLYPLLLIAKGHGRVARSLMTEYGGVDRTELALLVPEFRAKSSRFWFRARTGSGERALGDRLAALNDEISEVKVPVFRDPPPATARGLDESLGRVLRDLQPESVLDVRSVTPSFAIQAAELGSPTVAFCDRDDYASSLFLDARKQRLKLLPLILDFTKPTPSAGYFDHYSIAAYERLRCDLVVANDLVRHAVVDRLLTFEHIAEGLALFSRRWALVDFTPADRLPAYVSGRFPWYEATNLIEALRERFTEVSPVRSEADGRSLLLCRK